MRLPRPIRAFLALATGALLLSAPAAANAATVEQGTSVGTSVFSSQNPQAAYRALGASERAAFDSVHKVDRTSTTVRAQGVGANEGTRLSPSRAAKLGSTRRGALVSPRYSGCWAMQVSGSARAAAGNTLYTYGQSTQVCVRNNRVSGITVYNVWNETSTPGWRIDKRPTTSRFNAGWEGRGLAQYYFVLGAGGWDIQRPTTCLQLRLNANGYNYSHSRSCNLS